MAFSNSIVQNDNGVTLYFNIADEDGNTDVFNGISSVICKIIKDTTTITKTCSIVDIALGKCSAILLATDISSIGKYIFQLTLTYTNGNIYTTNPSKFNVIAKL